MQQNQKYFALADDDGRLVNRFLIVSNIETARSRARSSTATSACCARASPTRGSSSTRTARRGSKRACRSSRSVVYHNKLGTQLERVDAAASVSRRASPASIGADPAHARSRGAARQGRSRHRHGRRVSRAAGHDGPLLRAARRRGPPWSRDAIEQHYWPRFAGDALPESAGRAGGGARRQARDAGGHVRHRRSSRPATRIRSACAGRARRDPHPHRAQARRCRCRRW